MKRNKFFTRLALPFLCVTASACAIAPAAGPSTRGINRYEKGASSDSGIQIIDVDDQVARRLIARNQKDEFRQTLGGGHAIGSTIGNGDVLEIAIWEAPPAALFGVSASDSRISSSGATARGTTMPEQMVDSNGQIVVPFVGTVSAAGRTPAEVSSEISARLRGKAHQPEAIVRLLRNATSTVTVVGDVANNTRVPLTSKGERVLDVLASAGGARQAVGKTTLRISRGPMTATMPLESVIRDLRQNVILQPDDVMTVLYQPYSFVALGATSRNEEIPFEATGITLAQAMGRVAGLQDARADVKGVFLFRLEDPGALSPAMQATSKMTPDGKIPVIYRINMKDPAMFFVAQGFPIRDKDVLYASNAPLADFQKFVNVIYSTLLPVATTLSVTK